MINKKILIILFFIITSCSPKNTSSKMELIQMDNHGNFILKRYENNSLKEILSLDKRNHQNGYQTIISDSGIIQKFYYDNEVKFIREISDFVVQYYDVDNNDSLIFLGRRKYNARGSLLKDNLILDTTPFVWQRDSVVNFKFKNTGQINYLFVGSFDNIGRFPKAEDLAIINKTNIIKMTSSSTGIGLISGAVYNISSNGNEYNMIKYHQPLYCEDTNHKLTKEFLNDICFLLSLNW